MNMHPVPRRAALLGLAAGGAATACLTAVAQPSPDAELIALCGELDALERQVKALRGNEVECELAQASLEIRQRPLLDRICALHSRTAEGHAARARSLVLWTGNIRFEAAQDADEYWSTRLIAAMIRDLVHGAAAVAA